jgi:hypothetical protein
MPTERSPHHRSEAHGDDEEVYVERDGYLFVQYPDGCEQYFDTLSLHNWRRADWSPKPAGNTAPLIARPRPAKAQLQRRSAAKETA